MPSLAALGTIAATMGGAAVGGMAGWRYSNRRDDFDTEDRLGFAASSTVAGGAAGLAMRSIGLRGMGRLASGGYSAAATGGRLMMANPARSIMRKMGREKFGFSTFSKTGLKAGAMATLAVAGIAAIAYSARSNPETQAYAAPNGYGETDYIPASTVRDRMNLLSATGDMVFGLNNSRHG